MGRFTPYIILAILLFLYSCEREVTRSTAIDVKPINGKIFINSSPEGSEIYLNGKIQGKYTPDSLNWLPAEEIPITLKRPNYRDTTFLMLPKVDSVESIFVDYFANPMMYGRIKCITEPAGAGIFLNDSNTNRVTPDTLHNLVPGNYNIRFEKVGHRSINFDYLVTSNETVGNFYAMEDTTVWVTYSSDNSPLPDNNIFAVENDKYGNIWVASENYGLIKYDRKNWEIYTSDDHPALGYTSYSLAVDSNNVLWVGSSQGLLSCRDGNFSYYNSENSSLPEDQVYDLKVDAQNRLWVSTYGGIAKLDNGSITIYSKENGKSFANYVNCVETHGFDMVWAGHSRVTMSNLANDYFAEMLPLWEETQPEIFLGSSVNAIAAESNGDLWIGFYPEYRPGGGIGGLAFKRDTLWYKDFTPQISREIHDITISGYGEKVIATSGGLVVFTQWNDREIFTITNSGLYSSHISDICIDNQGIIWLATEHGVTKYKRKY
ncbi:MAG: hypothetical protein SCALA702_08720 [Melioribacteraceae bacterium]|nr:MAG: hypothetical protein SCALA702_08720 [Melioribacteraceae bacterium]